MSKKRKSHRRRRARLVIRRDQAPGAVPGEIASDPDSAAGSIHLIAYGPDTVEERDVPRSELARIHGSAPVVWLDLTGPGHLEALQQAFGLHPLALEDAVHLHQRPKVEEYGDLGFIVVCMPSIPGGLGVLDFEQVSLFVGPGYVITIQERSGDCLEPVRRRIRNDGGRIRRMGADYLAHSLIDAILDHYFPVVESYGDRLEELEDRIVTTSDDRAIHDLHALRHDLQTLRRVLWPTREAAGLLSRGQLESVTPETQVFFRDCADHASQLLDSVESCRELVSALMDLHVSNISQRMNEAMKVLTLIATIFIPLSFIAGIYGMNFDPASSPWNMPELGWYLGYPFALFLMAVVAIALLFYFRRKGWLGGTGDGASS